MKTLGLMLVLLVGSSCSGMMNRLSASVYGTPVQGTATASNAQSGQSLIALDNSGERVLVREEEHIGSYLAAQEFARLRDMDDDSARRGYRRPASPWSGVESNNEASLWDENLQSNFLFARNMIHRVGDLLTVKIENDINESLNEKIHTILLKRWPERFVKRAARDALNTNARTIADVRRSVENTARTEATDAANKALAEEADPIPRYLDVADMSVRITETLPRGSLKIAGTKRVQIQGAPYRLHLTGIIQGEDVGPDTTVSSRRVLESKMELTR